jgi:subtilisin family serine protease
MKRMASPAVTSLAAKLFAIDPSLTPKQARTLIVDGSTTSEDGRRKLVDQSRTIELARINKEKARGGTLSSSGMGVSPVIPNDHGRDARATLPEDTRAGTPMSQ